MAEPTPIKPRVTSVDGGEVRTVQQSEQQKKMNANNMRAAETNSLKHQIHYFTQPSQS